MPSRVFRLRELVDAPRFGHRLSQPDVCCFHACSVLWFKQWLTSFLLSYTGDSDKSICVSRQLMRHLLYLILLPLWLSFLQDPLPYVQCAQALQQMERGAEQGPGIEEVCVCVCVQWRKIKLSKERLRILSHHSPSLYFSSCKSTLSQFSHLPRSVTGGPPMPDQPSHVLGRRLTLNPVSLLLLLLPL